MQFTPIVITIAGVPVTFGAESLTPQETHLRDMTSNKSYSNLQTVKVGFSAPNVGRPSSFINTRVYKTPVVNELGMVTGIIRTDVKTTIPLVATPAERLNHSVLVLATESDVQVKNQLLDLVSWY